jgi:hypothetical protein
MEINKEPIDKTWACCKGPGDSIGEQGCRSN